MDRLRDEKTATRMGERTDVHHMYFDNTCVIFNAYMYQRVTGRLPDKRDK